MLHHVFRRYPRTTPKIPRIFGPPIISPVWDAIDSVAAPKMPRPFSGSDLGRSERHRFFNNTDTFQRKIPGPNHPVTSPFCVVSGSQLSNFQNEEKNPVDFLGVIGSILKHSNKVHTLLDP